MPDVIEVNNLVKQYGDFTAVDDVSFSVREGETFGILGPNGAGKTTTLEMIEGLKPVTFGEIFLAGHNVAEEPLEVKSLIGVQLQASSFFDGLNLAELVDTFASLYGREVDVMEILSEVQLEEKAEAKVKELSGGQKQRLSIAVALVNDPLVLFLDEPTTGLDPQARRNLWELISGISKRGKTVVLTTHYMDEAEVLCDRIAVMDHAKIIAMDTTADLLKLAGSRSTILFRARTRFPLENLQRLPGVLHASEEDSLYRVVTKDPHHTLPALFDQSRSFGPITDLQLRQPTLEDVFLKLTGHELRE